MQFTRVESQNEEEEKEVTDLNNSCEICMQANGFLLKCLKLKCKKQIHPFCLMEELWKRDMRVANGDDTVGEDAEMTEEF